MIGYPDYINNKTALDEKYIKLDVNQVLNCYIRNCFIISRDLLFIVCGIPNVQWYLFKPLSDQSSTFIL